MSYEAQSLHVFFFFFVFETPLNGFPFYSPVIPILWFRCLQACFKESCMYVSIQLFSKTPHETLKFQENPRKMYFQVICRAKFQNFSLHCLPWGHPAISKLEMAISWFSLADSSLDSWFLGWLWFFENIG